MGYTTIIAEVGANHGGTLESALNMVDLSAKSGADVVKFQLYTGYDLWRTNDKRLKDTIKYALPEEWIAPLIQRCKENKVKFLCTPFSPKSVNLLASHNVYAYKISSGDITYIPLLQEIAKNSLHKQVYLSTGAANFKEIDDAINILGVNGLILLHCIPGYPTLPKNAYIRRILDLTERYTMKMDIPVGVSSHLREWWVDVATIAYRAKAIEKHIDSESRIGPEAKHSLAPDEFAMFSAAVRDTEKAMADFNYDNEPDTYARKHYRRNPDDWLRPYER